MAKLMGICELCDRDEIELTVHHLTPKEKGGTFLPTALLCKACHKQIHAIYTNKELAVRLNTILLLKDDDEIKKYIKWIRKQPVSRSVKTKKSNRKQNK
jgi:hypothetical protein